MINTAVPEIIKGGISEGKLPGGPYYLRNIIKSSIGAQDSHLTLDVRQLDNQTVVTVKAKIDNTDLSVKTSCFTSKIGESVWSSTQGWEFTWLYYAPDGPGDFCLPEWQYMPWGFYKVSAEQLAADSAIKSAYEHLEEAKKGWFKPVMDRLNPDIPAGPIRLGVGVDHFAVSQYVGQDISGATDYSLYSLYQPCTGGWHTFQLWNPLDA